MSFAFFGWLIFGIAVLLWAVILVVFAIIKIRNIVQRKNTVLSRMEMFQRNMKVEGFTNKLSSFVVVLFSRLLCVT